MKAFTIFLLGLAALTTAQPQELQKKDLVIELPLSQIASTISISALTAPSSQAASPNGANGNAAAASAATATPATTSTKSTPKPSSTSARASASSANAGNQAAAAAPAASVVAGKGTTSNGGQCACQCLCGANSFNAPNAGKGAFGGVVGQLPAKRKVVS